MQSSPMPFVQLHGWKAIEVQEGQKKKVRKQREKKRRKGRRRAGGANWPLSHLFGCFVCFAFKPPTVGAIFRTQVNQLMAALKACQPHYIRCIKPNHTKKPNDFDKEQVTRQVRYLGLLEVSPT